MLMTPWVQRLLLANVMVFLLTWVNPGLRTDFAFIPYLALLRPWTIVTYAFLHANMWHIFLNMLMLFFFGPRLEERLGSRTFIWFYILCGIGGAALSFVFSPTAAVVGASGSIFGVVIGFARYWPREDIHIWGILPIQARMLALLMVFSSLFAGFTGAQDGIAHFAHLGGLATGWVFLLRWERRRHRRVMTRGDARRMAKEVLEVDDAVRRWEAIPRDQLHEINRDELDFLLKKVRTVGARALTRDERAFLDRMANSL